MPSAIPFFADRVWNRAPVPDLREFTRHLACRIFGTSLHPDVECMFEYLGSVLPPSAKSMRAFTDEKRALQPGPAADFRRMERLLRRESNNPRVWNPDMPKEYAGSIRWIRQSP